MNSKDKIIAIIFTILVSIICLIPIYYFKIYASLNNKKGILHLDSGDYMEVK